MLSAQTGSLTTKQFKYGYHVFMSNPSTLAVHELSTAYKIKKCEIEVQYTNFSLNQFSFPMYVLNQKNVEEFHFIGLQFTRKFKLNDSFELICQAKPNFTTNWLSKASQENLLLHGSIATEKKYRKMRILFGVGYDTYFGKSQIVPLFSFKNQVHNFLNYEIGFPKSEVNYSFTKQHKIGFNLESNSFYLKTNQNIVSQLYSEQNNFYEGFELYNILASLNFTFLSQNNWDTRFSFGKSVYSDFNFEQSSNDKIAIPFEKNLSISIQFNYKF